MKLIAFEKSVGGVIVRQEGKKSFFLLLHYPSGHWDFPKGHVEKGESDEQTLRREIKEETGIERLEVVSKFKKYSFYYYKAKRKERIKRINNGISTNVAKVVVYYLVKTIEKEVTISHEHKGFQWLEAEQALEKITFPKSRKVLQAAIERIQKD